MLKGIFKWSFKIVSLLILVAVLLYGGFHLWEYASGGKYIKYLSDNSETVPLESNFTLSNLDDDFEKNQLILVGEIHGFDEPTKFDVELFKHLNKNHGVNHYIAEVDFVQASMLNDFLKSGDVNLLKKILKNWVVMQGRNNKDYMDKYIELQKYYQSAPEENKFSFVGIDKIQDGLLIKEYLNNFFQDKKDEKVLKESKISSLIEELNGIYIDNADTLSILSHLKSNVEYYSDKLSRDEIMFQNFNSIYKKENLNTKKLYGYLGLGHVFLYRIDGQHPFASKVRTSDLGLEGKIFTMNIMMNDSHMVMPSNQLPEFMRDEGAYTKMPVSADNMLFVYIVGVKDFKRMTPEYHKSLVKMNGENNPYQNTSRLNKTIQLLPVTDIFEMTDKGKPYFQYTLFIRNSDWAEPMN